ncbi:MAG: gliding motility-associated C-terminal domain-containing protein [Bacteroidetes bacterium]|nr:gliding motility-associated C-terminal domain-containing protein [Bacteroidota bacterium]
MKKKLLLFIAIFSVIASNAQTIFWTEAFQNGCVSGNPCLVTLYTTGPNGPWTQTSTGLNDPESNKWFVSGAECGNAPPACGSVCGAADPSLHIGADDGFVLDQGASYDAGGFCGVLFCVTTNMRVESPTINCTGQSTITLAFNYIANGDVNDDATLWYYDGATWTMIDPLAKPPLGVCAPQGRWTAYSILLPASANNNPNVKIGFNWTNNDDGIPSNGDPSIAVDDITLSVPSGGVPVASFSTSSTTVCAAQCVTFTDASTNAPTSWSWNFQGGNPATATTQTVCVTYSASGTYTASLTATNANGSGSTTQTITITVTPLPTANAGTDVTICQSANTTLSATGGGTYAWLPITGLSNPNISNPVASPTITTNYSVTVTNSCGSNTDAVNVTVNPLPTANAGADITVCPSANSILTATGGGNYLWSTGQSIASISVSPTITTSYSVTVTNSCGSSIDSVTVVVSNNITATISGITTICAGQSTTLTAGGGSNYSWSNGTLTAVVVLSPTSTTTYSVFVTSGTCADTVAVTVNITSPPTATITGNNPICSGQSVILTAGGGNSYSWISGGQTTTSITVSPITNTTYSVIAFVGSCADTTSATVTVLAAPNASVNSTSICTGDAATLTASGGGTYSWNTGQTSSSIVVNPASTTNYTVTVTGVNTCTASAVGNVSVISAVNAVVSGSLTFCQGQGTTLCASGGCNYSWTTGATTSCIPVTSAGTYSVYASCGSCSDTTSAAVTVNSNPTATVSSDTTISQGATVALSASGGGTYSWGNGATTQAISVSPSATTQYCVTVTNAGNCTASACVTVTVDLLDCGEIFVPNAFSPNKDGQNELECVLGKCIETFSFSIYDRWGEKVFTTDNLKICWDGIYKGKLMNSAEFVYYLEATLTNGKKESKKGNISLIR